MSLVALLLTWPTIATSSKVLASDNACFNAIERDESTIFNAPLSGTLMGIELIYQSGSVNCDRYNYSHWGCARSFHDYVWDDFPHKKDDPFMIFLEQVTDSTSYTGTKYYPTMRTDDIINITKIEDYLCWYHMDPESFTIHSPLMALINPTYIVSTSDTFMLQYGEASGQSNGDNDGSVCASVYFIYQEDPICISGTETLDAKYEFAGPRSYYATAIDKYLYYESQGDNTTSLNSSSWSLCVADEVDGDNYACCGWNASDITSLNLAICTGTWSDTNEGLSSSTYCQDMCVANNTHSSLDGTYVWHHYNISSDSSVYYCSSCWNAFLFLWLYDSGVWNWRIGPDYTTSGAWVSCRIERTNDTPVFPYECENWRSVYDGGWKDDNTTMDSCYYEVPTNIWSTRDTPCGDIYTTPFQCNSTTKRYRSFGTVREYYYAPNCIFDGQVCNGREDCPDGSDESSSTCEDHICNDREFKCDYGGCILNEYVCNGYEQCLDGSDEREMFCSYCALSVYGFKKAVYNTDEELAGASFVTWMKGTGVDFLDAIVLILLLYMNVITSIFIVIGLCLYQTNIGFDKTNINYVTLLIITLQMLLIMSSNLSTKPIVACNLIIGDFISLSTISWLDVTQYMLFAILWFIWCTYSCKYSCCRYFVVCFIIIVPILVGFVSHFVSNSCSSSNDADYLLWDGFSQPYHGADYHICNLVLMENYSLSYPMYSFYRTRFFGSWVCYHIFQTMIPTIWCALSNKLNNKCNCKLKCKHCKPAAMFVAVVTGGVGIQIAIFMIGGFLENDCMVFSGYLWFNPVFMIMSIYLLFSDARCAILGYHVIIASLVLIGALMPGTCTKGTLAYSIHCVIIPLYIIIIFATIEELKKWKLSIISMYLVSFDIVTDIIVIYYFIVETHDYIFAILQISFILTGQVFGAFSDNLSAISDIKLTTTDKVASLFGFSGPWFLIKSWSEVNGETMYLQLSKKHKIWELMFEGFPSVALQIYALLVIDESSGAIIPSIVISSLKIAFTVWMYLVKLAHHENDDESDHDTNENAIELTTVCDEHKHQEETASTPRVPSFVAKKFGKVLESKRLYGTLYIFMISDFYFRTLPIVILISIIPCKNGETICINRFIAFMLLFGGLLIVEFIMNKRMRIKSHQSTCFVVQIFSISILSSFYTLLSSLDILKNDIFFGQSVNFRAFLIEHKIRICLSVIINIVNVSLLSVEFNSLILVLVLVYVICLIANLFATRYIQTYTDQTQDATN
eukprot:761734_1